MLRTWGAAVLRPSTTIVFFTAASLRSRLWRRSGLTASTHWRPELMLMWALRQGCHQNRGMVHLGSARPAAATSEPRCSDARNLARKRDFAHRCWRRVRSEALAPSATRLI